MRGERFSFPDFFSNNPILAAICVVFLVGDIVLLDHIVTDRVHQKEITRYQYEIKALQNTNEKMNDKYSQLNDLYKFVDHKYKELEARNNETQMKIDSQISSLTANLNSCQDTNLSFITKMKEQDSETASLRNDLRDSEEKLAALRNLFAQQLALGPSWIKAGEVSRAFGDDVAVVVDESSDRGQCPKEAAAVVHLDSGGGKRDLCLQMDRPQTFTYKGKKLLLHLLGVRENEPPHEYLVSIVKEREKTGGETR
ncbi:MAG: hypothetical protein ABSE08_13360 [Syntrophobacteraceae bacterium]|jgi:septal ring factor EnvC (AmiA/AmiB activator)